MKNKTGKRLSALLMALLISGMSCVPSFASSVDYSSHGVYTITLDKAGTLTSTDLFGIDLKGLMPGDTVEKDITVKVTTGCCPYVKLYMKALPLSVEPDSVPEGMTAADVEKMKDFLSKLSMEIYLEDKLIYSASPDQTDGLTEYLLLGDFKKGTETKLHIVLHVPEELGNEYACSTGEVNWQFLAIEISNNPPGPDPKPVPDPKPLPDPKRPVETTEPMSGDLEEGAAPSRAVATGDTSNLLLYSALLAGSAGLIGCLIVAGRKKKEEE